MSGSSFPVRSPFDVPSNQLPDLSFNPRNLLSDLPSSFQQPLVPTPPHGVNDAAQIPYSFPGHPSIHAVKDALDFLMAPFSQPSAPYDFTISDVHLDPNYPGQCLFSISWLHDNALTDNMRIEIWDATNHTRIVDPITGNNVGLIGISGGLGPFSFAFTSPGFLLSEGATYTVRLYANNVYGSSVPAIATFAVPLGQPISNVRSVQVNSNTVAVLWDSALQGSQTYDVMLRNMDTGGNLFNYTVDRTPGSLEVDFPLGTPGHYQGFVQQGQWPEVAGTPLVIAPPPPTLTAQEISPGTVRVTWANIDITQQVNGAMAPTALLISSLSFGGPMANGLPLQASGSHDFTTIPAITGLQVVIYVENGTTPNSQPQVTSAPINTTGPATPRMTLVLDSSLLPNNVKLTWDLIDVTTPINGLAPSTIEIFDVATGSLMGTAISVEAHHFDMYFFLTPGAHTFEIRACGGIGIVGPVQAQASITIP